MMLTIYGVSKQFCIIGKIQNAIIENNQRNFNNHKKILVMVIQAIERIIMVHPNSV